MTYRTLLCLLFAALGAALSAVFGYWSWLLYLAILLLGCDLIAVFLLLLLRRRKVPACKTLYLQPLRIVLRALLLVLASRVDAAIGSILCREMAALGLIAAQLLCIADDLMYAGVPRPKALQAFFSMLRRSIDCDDAVL